jgi:hypothetical protein
MTAVPRRFLNVRRTFSLRIVRLHKQSEGAADVRRENRVDVYYEKKLLVWNG